MGLDPKLLNSMPDTLVKLYSEVEESILQDMARRLMAYDYYIPAAQYQEQKLRELGLCQQDIVKRLSQITGKSQQELRQMMNEAGETVVKQDVDYYKLADVYEPSAVDAEALYKRLNSGLKQTNGAFTNITRTMANTATGQFETALDKAWLQVSSGTFDHNTAVRNAVKGLAKQGIQAIQYPSGRTDSIEVAVRRAVVTGLNQTAMHVSMELADELGVDLVEVSAHSGARPEHAVWQGKCYSRNGRKVIDGVVYEDLRKATGYGTGAGLGGWNCRHSISPYVHGAARAYSDEQLKEYEAKKIRYNGKMYTEYEASQIQRALERDIRRWKRESAALSAIGEDTTMSAVRLKSRQAALSDFIRQTGLKRQGARELNGNWGRTLAGSAAKDANAYYKQWSKSVNVNNAIKTLAKYYKVKYNDPPRYELLRGYVKSVSAGKLSPLAGFDLYEEYHSRIETEIAGRTTVNGIKITGQTHHFLERVFGTVCDPKTGKPREGVSLEDVKDALFNGTVRKTAVSISGSNSVLLVGKTAAVSVNPDTGQLIQTNPRR